MTQQSRTLDIEITRDKTEIVDEFMAHRNQKVESDTEFPASYQANIYGTGNEAENAFYEAFADSYLMMTPTPGSGFQSLQDVARAIKTTEDAEVDLRAKVEGIEDHAPVVQTGIEALEEAGFEPYAEIHKEKPYGGSIVEAVNQIEEEGVPLSVWSSEDPVNDHPDSHYVVARYHPDNQTLEPDTSLCAPAHGTEEEADEINQMMEDALGEVGLLE